MSLNESRTSGNGAVAEATKQYVEDESGSDEEKVGSKNKDKIGVRSQRRKRKLPEITRDSILGRVYTALMNANGRPMVICTKYCEGVCVRTCVFIISPVTLYVAT